MSLSRTSRGIVGRLVRHCVTQAETSMSKRAGGCLPFSQSSSPSVNAMETGHRRPPCRTVSTTQSPPRPGPQLTHDSLNEHLLHAQYAVRGEIVLRAMEHHNALARGEKRPFDKVIHCNIGNPQELNQKPLTFPREVTALVNHPGLLDMPGIESLFSQEAIDRSRDYIKNIPGGVGAYSNSQGVEYVRQEVANFLEKRDGHPAHANTIFLTDGASPGVQMLIRSMIRDEKDSIMIPIPQYPLYSASIALFGGTQLGYYLEEESNWGMTMHELGRAYQNGKDKQLNVRAMAVINPGNPTGGCLSEEMMQSVIQFCVDNNMVLLADEVYQENIWAENKNWQSFKKIACDMGMLDPNNPSDPSKNKLQLVSFHSISKGYLGECGRRGGYFELMGFDNDVKQELYKLASVSLCSNLNGQVMIGLMTNPPSEGSDAYEQWKAEKYGILASLKRRSIKLSNALNQLEGVSCQTPEGALYAFPQITLPKRAVVAAQKAGKPADTFYCLNLLDETGVVVVPGTGFGQKEGTFHFRTTILPSEDEIDSVIQRVTDFHHQFMDLYRD